MKTNRAGAVKFSENIELAKTKDENGANVNRCMVRNGKFLSLIKKKKYSRNIMFPTDLMSWLIKMKKYPQEKCYFNGILIQMLFWLDRPDYIAQRFFEGDTYQVEAVEGGKKQMVIIEAKDRSPSPRVEIYR
ncbi:MAG: hypothetical protein CM1200mP10_27150 [Candidatus Neomarinimicrobiota bacterium]|nr:MAG: hypothetical protein CM1200mP10_27150 [Candidatus Neomarinimicrobiota bacterium]